MLIFASSSKTASVLEALPTVKYGLSVKFRLSALLLFCLFILFSYQPTQVWSAPGAADSGPIHIGRVLKLKGSVSGQVGDRGKKTLQLNDKIFAGEKIITGEGDSVVLKFRDGSNFTLGSDAEIKLNEFVFNPFDSVTTNTISVNSGAFRFNSGFAVITPQIAIRMPTATVGVRGTVVEGVVAENYPNFVNLPVGEAISENGGGELNLGAGESLAVVDEFILPVEPKSLLPAMRVGAIDLIKKEVDPLMSAVIPLTKDQLMEDAKANRASIAKQKIMVNSFPAATSNHALSPKKSLINRTVVSFYRQLELFSNGLSFIQAAHGASLKELAKALDSLAKAAKLGLLTTPTKPLTKEQKLAQTEFIKGVEKQFPDAAKVLEKHQKQQEKLNRDNKKQSSMQIIAGVASVASDIYEVAAIVKSAVVAARRGDADIIAEIIGSALIEVDFTDNAEAAAVISAVAALADPDLAERAAVTAINSLPESQRKIAPVPVATAVAAAAPGKAALVAAAVTKIASAEYAAYIAAAVTQAVNGENAGAIAAAVARVAPASETLNITAAVTRVAGPRRAGKIAAAVTQAVGPKFSGAVAATATKVAGPEVAYQIAAAVVHVAGPKFASLVAAAVTQVAGAKVASQIAGAVIQVTLADTVAGVAGAVTKVSGADADTAAAIAVIIIKVAGVETIGMVTAIVTEIAGVDVANGIINDIADSTGKTVAEINLAIAKAKKSSEFDIAIQTAEELAKVAIEIEKEASAAEAIAIEAEKIALEAVESALSAAELVVTKTETGVDAAESGVAQEDAAAEEGDDSGSTATNTTDDEVVSEEEEKPIIADKETTTYSPTDISLSSSTVKEYTNRSSDVVVGTLTTTDASPIDSHTYTIAGGDDEAMFSISGDTLYVVKGKTVVYDSTKSLSVIIRSTDSKNNILNKTMTITVTEAFAATDIALSSYSFDEKANATADVAIATLSATDADDGDSHTYTIVGGDDEAKFSISGDTLYVVTGDTVYYSVTGTNTLSVIVRATDSYTKTYDEELTITVNDTNVGLDTMTYTNIDQEETVTGGTKLGYFTHNDPDEEDSITYSITSAINNSDSSDSSSIFFISGDYIAVTTAGLAALEDTATYTVTIKGVDEGGLGGEADFTISVIPYTALTYIRNNSRILYENIRTTLTAGSSYNINYRDLLTLILGKIDKQFTGIDFTIELDDIVEEVAADIGADGVIVISFTINNLNSINSKLNNSSITGNWLTNTSSLADFIGYDSVNVTFSLQASISGTTVSFDTSKSTVQIKTLSGVILDVTYYISDMITQYNDIVTNYLPSGLHFFAGDSGTTSQSIPTSYDLNASGNYLDGRLSSITISDNSILLAP
ncbi:MAG: FecR domain-containing protein [Magnetococcales bacterium]|nr:FecR domain-containing protein [Magnetococcales bacterium]